MLARNATGIDRTIPNNSMGKGSSECGFRDLILRPNRLCAAALLPHRRSNPIFYCGASPMVVILVWLLNFLYSL